MSLILTFVSTEPFGAPVIYFLFNTNYEALRMGDFHMAVLFAR
jgi:hypothetical protein